ncbi:MAG: stage V sporulation protein AB [Tissierella sp.]|nr:stage V sporulation protein AB [Tissierella sp.]
MINLLIILIGLSGGLVVGGAYAAFISMLRIIPRLAHISKTHKYKRTYQNAYILGVIAFTISYFFDFNMKLNDIMIGIIGFTFGTFTGLFSSALAEVLNVIPVLAKKLRMKEHLKLIIYALLFGKVAGSLYFWLVFKKIGG